MLDFRILGPIEVVETDGTIRLGGPRQRATLAILLLEANRVVSVERLAEALYAGAAPVTAVTQVQRQISDLRKVLPKQVIETRSPGYVIHVLPEQLDLNRFERQAENASQLLVRGEAQRAAELLREALALWRGTPLADTDYAWSESHLRQLEATLAALAERTARARLDAGDAGGALQIAERGLKLDELDETFIRLLLEAEGALGQREALVDRYETFRHRLDEMLGLKPERETRRLYRQLLAGD